MTQIESRIAPSPEAASEDFASPSQPGPAEERAYWRGFADGLRRAGADVPSDVAARATAEAPDEALPWDCELGSEADVEAGRQRHDAFAGARKQAYLKALAKVGCILDACRLTGVSSSTVYNHQASDPDFDRHCRLALDMASTPLELTAYERAVVGVEEDVIRGDKVVGTRIRRSDYMLRVMLQGANPKKYGPRPGFGRKRLLKFEREQIEREIRGRLAAEAEGAEGRRDVRAMVDEIGARIEQIKQEQAEARLATGWTDLGCGISVPPGWTWAGEGDPVESLAEALKKRDAVYNSSNSSTSPAPNLSPAPPIP